MSFKDKILNNQSPWGAPPGGGDGGRGSPGGNGSGSRREPPNIDDIIKTFKKLLISFWWKLRWLPAYNYRFSNCGPTLRCKRAI